MTTYRVSHQSGHIEAKLSIHGSKSIHQRLLVIKHLYQNNLKLSNPSHSNDVLVLTEALLQINKKKGQGCNINVQDAGTATRLLVPILAITPGMWNLEGTARMNERPISDLVDSLGSLNDQIEYANETGKLPLTIRGIDAAGPDFQGHRIASAEIHPHGFGLIHRHQRPSPEFVERKSPQAGWQGMVLSVIRQP